MGTVDYLWLTTDERLQRLLGGVDDPVAVVDAANADQSGRCFEVGKGVEFLHFMLTGADWSSEEGDDRREWSPLHFLSLSGGEFVLQPPPLPVWPPGGSPKREVHDSELVVIWSRRLPAIDRALRELDIERVHRRFERAELSARPAHVGEVLRWIAELHAHVRRGAEEGLGMLSFSE